MRALNFQDKYPIFTADIEKSGCIYADLPALTAYFKNCIRQEPKVQYLGEFDHLAHTRAIGGEATRRLLAPLTWCSASDWRCQIPRCWPFVRAPLAL